MEDELTRLPGLIGSLERACSIQVLDVQLDQLSASMSRSLGLVELLDSHRSGVHLIEIGPGELLKEQLLRLNLLHQTPLGKYISVLANQSTNMSEKTGMLVYELKGCPVRNISTLRSLLRAEQPDLVAASGIVQELANALYEWNSKRYLESNFCTKDVAWELLNKSMRESVHEDLPSVSYLEHVQAHISTVIGDESSYADALLFDDCSLALPNPSVYLPWSDLWPSNLVIVWPKGHQLGNLATGCVVVTGNSGFPFYICDFSSYKQGLLFTDWFYLEIDLLLNYLRLETHLGWKEFIVLTRELTSSLMLPDDIRLSGDRAPLIWELLKPLRANLKQLVRQLSQSGVSEDDFELSAWMSAIVAGIKATLEDTSRTEIERKGALFYAANALTRLLPRNPKNEPIVPARRVLQVHRTARTSKGIDPYELDRYIQWVVEDGGATKRVIAGLDDWFVQPETQLARVIGVRHYDEEWLIDLEQQWGSGFQPEKRQKLGGMEDLKNFIEEQHRAVLLGEPGSGKTTLLEHLFLEFAGSIKSPTSYIPVLIRLGSFRGDKSFEDFILEQLGNLAPYFGEIKNRIVLLCDALNEMPYTSYSPDKRNLLDEVRVYLENTTITWMLSCRVRDYVSNKLNQVGRGVKRIEILPLDLPKIQQVIQRRFRKMQHVADGLWVELCGETTYAGIIPQVWKKFEQHGDATRFWEWRGIDALQSLTAAPQYISEREQIAWKVMHERKLMRLCQNPYMLKLIALVYVKSVKEGRPMPNIQGQIIHQVATDLIDNERLRRQSVGENWPKQLDAKILKSLQVIAFSMQAHHETLQTETEITRGDAITAVEKEFQGQAEYLIELGSSTQILVGDDKKLRFSHQLMQEYFAGMTLVDSVRSVSPVTYWPKESWWEPSRLDETAVILVGWYQEWPEIIRWIAQANPELAAECLTRNDRSPSDLTQEIRDLIRDTIQNKVDTARSAQERAAAFRAWGWFGDTRAGVGVAQGGLPHIQWSKPILPGSFQMGGDSNALKSWLGITQTIDYTYFVAKYPITVSQYRCFVDDGGYTEKWRNCWTRSGWEWKLKMNKTSPYAWNNPHWSVPNFPVIGVTWFEAYAFTRWLHLKLTDSRQLPEKSLVVRLPTEAEWEKSARGTDGRLYPWGASFEPNRANVKEGQDYIGRTSAVGLFGERSMSPYGIEDMSGNVWEWCLTEWRESYDANEPIRLDTEAARSSRGGSWFHSANHARAASRFWYRPGVADFCWGLRVCASVDLQPTA